MTYSQLTLANRQTAYSFRAKAVRKPVWRTVAHAIKATYKQNQALIEDSAACFSIFAIVYLMMFL